MSQSKRGRNETASEHSLLNSYQKINSQLTGEKISKQLNSTIKKEDNESKIKQLKSLQNSLQQYSHTKKNLETIGEISKRKTVVFKQHAKLNATELMEKENIFNSFQIQFSKEVSSGPKQESSLLPNHGIGDGIGDVDGLDENNSKCGEVDPSPVVVEEVGQQEGQVTSFDTTYFKSDAGHKTMTGILKKK